MSAQDFDNGFEEGRKSMKKELETSLAEAKELSELRLKSEQTYAWRNIELNTGFDALKQELASLTIKINTRADAYARATDERDALRLENEKLKNALNRILSCDDLEGHCVVSDRCREKAQSILSGEAKS